jgi:hypothetical protein
MLEPCFGAQALRELELENASRKSMFADLALENFVTYLALFDKLSGGSIYLLNGVADYLLGGLAASKQQQESSNAKTVGATKTVPVAAPSDLPRGVDARINKCRASKCAISPREKVVPFNRTSASGRNRCRGCSRTSRSRQRWTNRSVYRAPFPAPLRHLLRQAALCTNGGRGAPTQSAATVADKRRRITNVRDGKWRKSANGLRCDKVPKGTLTKVGING